MVIKNIRLTYLAYEQNNKSTITQLIKGHLQSHKDITAIFAVHYNIAVLVRIAALELNLSIPEDVSIICFDSPERSINNSYEFTYIKQGEREMGEKAMDAIVSLIEGKDYPEKTIIETILKNGKSTRKMNN